MFGKVVSGVKGEKFQAIIHQHKDKLKVRLDVQLDAQTLASIVQEFKRLVRQETRQDFPEHPREQLRMAG